MNTQSQQQERPKAHLPIQVFKNEMKKLGDELPVSADIPRDRMESALVVAVQKSPKLLAADRSSLWLSIRMCASDGLLPDGREAALVIFKTKIDGHFVDAVQYIPMVYGLRKRAMKSGLVTDINAVIVYAGEYEAGRFEYIEGDVPKISHRPILEGVPGEPERGAPIGSYAIATFKDGRKVREFMSAGDIERVRRAASSQKVFKKGQKPTVSDVPIGVWADDAWWDEQWKKSAVRRLSKKLPLSSEDQRIIQESESHDLEPKDVTPEPRKQTFAEAATAARNNSNTVDQEEAIPEAETIDDNTPKEDASGKSDEFAEGMQAHIDGNKRGQCAYAPGDAQHDDWVAGWDHSESVSPQTSSKAKKEAKPTSDRENQTPTPQEQGEAGFAAGMAIHKNPYDDDEENHALWVDGYMDAAAKAKSDGAE